MVYRILSRFVDTIESVFRGDPRDQLAASEATAKAQFEARTALANTRVANRLMSLHRELGPNTDPQKVRDRVDQIVAELVPGDLASEPTGDSTVTNDAGDDDKDGEAEP